MDFREILTCGTIIGDHGGRQDVGKEALQVKIEKKSKTSHNTFFVSQNRVLLLFSLSLALRVFECSL